MGDELTAEELTRDTRRVQVSPPRQPRNNLDFVQSLEPVINAGNDGIIRAETEEARRRDDVLTKLLETSSTPTQSVFQDTFDQQIERTTGQQAPQFLQQLRDEQLKLTQLQNKFRTAAQKTSSAEGQSKAFEAVQLGELSREEAVQVGNQAMLVQALQNNFSTAREIALDVARFASEDRRAELDNLITQLNALSGIVEGQEAQLLEQRKNELEAEKAELERTQEAIDAAIVSGTATVQEMQQLTSTTVPQEQKRALAQSIVARGAAQDRSLNRETVRLQQENLRSQIEARANEALEKKIAENAAAEEKAIGRTEKALGTFSLASQLLNHPGLNNAVGTNRLGRWGTPFSGDKAEFIAKAEQLANKLTIENLDVMSGPLTDKDIEIIASAASTLKARNVSEATYEAEIQRIVDASRRIMNNLGITAEQAQAYGFIQDDDAAEIDSLWTNSAVSTPALTQ